MNLNREKCIRFGKDPDSIITKLKLLENGLGERVLKKLNKEKNRHNFISALTEIKFMKELSDLNFEIEYEKKYRIENSEKTPDLTLNLNGQKSIIEIYRLGSSKKDDLEEQYINKVWSIVTKTESDILLELRFKNENFYLNDFNSCDLKKQIQEFLNHNPKINTILDFNSDIQFIVLKKGKNKQTQLLHEPLMLDIKSGKLEQSENLSDNEITKKISKYKKVVESLKIPYLIGIETDFISGFHYTDFKEILF